MPRIRRERGGSDSPLNISTHEIHCAFLDGGFDVYGGNYMSFGGTWSQGASVHGTVAFRWLLWRLGYEQPRRFAEESRALTELECEGIERFRVKQI
jgi:hypothetical protein